MPGIIARLEAVVPGRELVRPVVCRQEACHQDRGDGHLGRLLLVSERRQ